MSPIGALRAGLREAIAGAGTSWQRQQEERAQLILAVPELRRRMIDEFVSSMEPFARALADRVGRPPDDFAVRNLVGAVLGVGLTAWLQGSGTPGGDYVALMDAAFAHLEAGLPL